MSFNPVNTKWSVANMDNDGKVDNFSPTPWVFNEQSMNAELLWAGGYQFVLGNDDKISCQIIAHDSPTASDSFEVNFITPDRFIATKDGKLYRFGKKI
jgi:hypothetical protein